MSIGAIFWLFRSWYGVLMVRLLLIFVDRCLVSAFFRMIAGGRLLITIGFLWVMIWLRMVIICGGVFLLCMFSTCMFVFLFVGRDPFMGSSRFCVFFIR